jgi:elongator complex protein 3
MLPPKPCEHGECIFCPKFKVPQSYTPKSPVVLRAKEVNFDPYKQAVLRIKAFEAMNHPTEKIEIIIMGGIFFSKKNFRKKFIKGIFDGLNKKVSKNLEEAKKINETAKNRCVALCIETRPDWCVDYIKEMREYGCTRVELGVQAIDE